MVKESLKKDFKDPNAEVKVTSGVMEVSIFKDAVKIDKIKEGPAGSIIVPAKLTRSGVFDYVDYLQLRSEEEVFDESSLKTLNDIP